MFNLHIFCVFRNSRKSWRRREGETGHVAIRSLSTHAASPPIIFEGPQHIITKSSSPPVSVNRLLPISAYLSLSYFFAERSLTYLSPSPLLPLNKRPPYLTSRIASPTADTIDTHSLLPPPKARCQKTQTRYRTRLHQAKIHLPPPNNLLPFNHNHPYPTRK